PFWVEETPFAWDDALVYMVMTDRFVDGDKGNNGGATPGSTPTGDFKGGDLEGLRQKIADGTLDQLGVRAIWLTPFQTNPDEAYPAADNVHQVTGYHGYWPTKGREVAPRLGGSAALHAMVEEAHQHGIRILQDYVVNHVHAEHEYFKQHPEWFRTGCVCGTGGCDWTEKALECLFASYLPDVNHTVPEANAQFVDDAVYWLDEYDLDGLRVDAVKHVEEVATRNLAAEVREVFEKAGTKAFMMGETAMGWGDCADPCNDQNYGTISRYVGPQGLDGQFDFVLYHAVAYNTFAYQSKGMLHADYWVSHGLQKWPQGAIMTPYIGSHDTARFVTLADPANAGKQGNQWSDIAQAPGDDGPRQRLRLAMAWMLGLPGAPLLYYGDEYGDWGGADPNNRSMWRPEAQQSAEEKATLGFMRKLGQARRNLPALRRGSYVSYDTLAQGTKTDEAMIFGRKAPDGSAAIVGINRSGQAIGFKARAKDALGLAAGTTLTDALGGPGGTVDGSGLVSVTVPANGAVVLAP
ncbi:MAG: glycosyl hydrolase, partial [Myxococcales bacterium]